MSRLLQVGREHLKLVKLLRALPLIAATVVVVSMSTACGALTAPPTSGLKLWLDARDTNADGTLDSLADAAEVETWMDKSGNINNGVARKDLVNAPTLTEGTNPTFSATGGPGGTSAIRFNGLDQAYQTPEFLTSDTYSMFFVAKAEAGAGAGYKPLYWDYAGDGNKVTYFSLVQTAARDNDGDSITSVWPSEPLADWDAATAILSNDGGVYSLETGLISATSVLGNPAYNSTTWETQGPTAKHFPTIGVFADGNALHAFAGWISQVLIYDHAVTGQERADIIDFLNGVLNPPPQGLPGDFDNDNDVDGADFVIWQTNFPLVTGATLATGDADGDGDVDGADFGAWQTSFPGSAEPGASPVPEPSSIILLSTLGGIVALARWRRRAKS